MMSFDKKNIFQELKKKDVEEILNFLSADEQNELIEYFDIKKWLAGEIVMKDGEPGDFMGFLVKGKLAVKKETAFPGKYTLVAILDKGAMVGEASALDAGKRTATVEAMEDSTLLVLTRVNMDDLFKKNRELGMKILKRILHVLNMRLQNADDRLAWLL